MGWDSKWPTTVWQEPTNNPNRIGIDQAKAKADETITIEHVKKAKDFLEAESEIDKAMTDASLHGQGFTKDGNHILLAEVYYNEDGSIAIKEFNNQIPTHDPYTNPGAFLYYECECGQRLDPHTKRFAELNNSAMNSGWKIRFGSSYYIPYCPECAKEKGIE